MKLRKLILAFTAAMTGMTASAQNFEIESFTTPGGKKVEITLIKHGTLAVSIGDFWIHVDPVGSYDPGNFSQFPKADVILVTHEHGDHLDAAAIETLSKPQTLLLVNAKSQESLQKGQAMANGTSLWINDFLTIDAVAAYNNTEGHTNFHPKGNGNGYILNIDGLKIYVAGDTEDIEEMNALSGIDVCFLPVNQPFTMTVDQAIKASLAIKPKVLIPYHYSNTDLKPLKDALDKMDSGIDVRIRNMQ